MRLQKALLASSSALAPYASTAATVTPTETITVTGIRPRHPTDDFRIEDAYEQYQPLGPGLRRA